MTHEERAKVMLAKACDYACGGHSSFSEAMDILLFHLREVEAEAKHDSLDWLVKEHYKWPATDNVKTAQALEALSIDAGSNYVRRVNHPSQPRR